MSIIKHIQSFHDSVLDFQPFALTTTIKQQDKHIDITLGYPIEREKARLSTALSAHLHANGFADIDITINSAIQTHTVQAGLKPLAGVKNIIAVASGKGGVGKSTVSVNLATSLQQQGAMVGILDADIYGPSQAQMLGGATRPESLDGKTMQPVIRHGMQTLSIGDLIDEDTAMIWRGPMVTQTLMQLFNECRWQALDYLIIDLPPGTGDTQLTLAQQIPVSGAVIVSTPQDIALLDAKKAKTMFDKVAINVLGLIENMSFYTCPQCGHQAHIFGQDGGKKLAQQYDIPLLGQLPLDQAIRLQSDQGIPIVNAQPDSEIATLYRQIALKLSANLAGRQKSFSQVFPKIVVER